MNQITSSYLFEKIKYVFDSGIVGRIFKYTIDFFNALPFFVKVVFFILLVLALLGILLSHFFGILLNRLEWKPMSDSKLYFSYFCGSGSFQRKKIYQDAHRLLRDKKWLWISIARPACNLGNFNHPSKLLMFACSLLYLPMAILGGVEMILRLVIGTAWLLAASLLQRMILFALRWISYLLIPLWNIADRIARAEQHCSLCYKKFHLPGFICPHCGVIHKQLIPGRCGILIARCECGHFLPSSAFSGRSHLSAVCTNPECNNKLVAANAKPFTILLVGGNTCGKTAFLAAFQRIYLGNRTGIKKLKIYGRPHDDFLELDKMFLNGKTEPSSATDKSTYNFIHKFGHNDKHNLIIYDIPDEVILSGDFEKNPRYFAYADGIVIMVDPLSIPSVREECLRIDGKKAVENYSVDDIGTIIIQFIHKFTEIKGLSAETVFDIPVAVIIGKTDIKGIKQEIGLSEIKTKYTANPADYGNSLLKAREKICREYLSNSGLTNALNNLEGVFSNIQYFPVSAIGHLREYAKAFEPIGVMEPVTWIAGVGNAGMYKALKNVQNLVTKNEFKDTAGRPLLKKFAGLYSAFVQQTEKIKKFR